MEHVCDSSGATDSTVTLIEVKRGIYFEKTIQLMSAGFLWPCKVTTVHILMHMLPFSTGLEGILTNTKN